MAKGVGGKRASKVGQAPKFKLPQQQCANGGQDGLKERGRMNEALRCDQCNDKYSDYYLYLWSNDHEDLMYAKEQSVVSGGGKLKSEWDGLGFFLQWRVRCVCLIWFIWFGRFDRFVQLIRGFWVLRLGREGGGDFDFDLVLRRE